MGQDIFVLIEHVRGQVADLSYMMIAQANQLKAGGKVIGLLLGNGAQSLANDVAADEIWYIDHPSLAEFTGEAYSRVVGEILKTAAPKAVFFADSTIGSEVAGTLSIRLDLPLVSNCIKVRLENNCLEYVAQICGGKMLAEGILPDGGLVLMAPGAFRADEGRSQTPPVVKTLPAPDLSNLRVTIRKYNEPVAGDIDITRESILIGIGRGIQREDNLELANELAEALGGAVCATRPVIDQNWLPTSRLVGKSGKAVKPRVYFAFGISGAPEHTEAITSSDMIIAVNTDPAAPIFNLARYGAETDLLDLIPAITEQVRAAK